MPLMTPQPKRRDLFAKWEPQLRSHHTLRIKTNLKLLTLLINVSSSVHTFLTSAAPLLPQLYKLLIDLFFLADFDFCNFFFFATLG